MFAENSSYKNGSNQPIDQYVHQREIGLSHEKEKNYLSHHKRTKQTEFY